MAVNTFFNFFVLTSYRIKYIIDTRGVTKRTIGEKIKLLREEAKLSQGELAEKANTTKQNIYKYEKGIITNIPSDRIELIANALSTTPAYLMGWNDEDSSDALVNDDEELTEYLEELKTRPELRMIFSLTKNATKKDVEKAAKIIEALLSEGDDN